MRNFRDLDIWKESIDFVTIIYTLVENFPNDEKYGLSQQIKRSVISIPSNISEGCRGSDSELIQYLSISLGSAFEVETQLIVARNLNFVQHTVFEQTLDTLHILQRKINAFRSTIKNN